MGNDVSIGSRDPLGLTTRNPYIHRTRGATRRQIEDKTMDFHPTATPIRLVVREILHARLDLHLAAQLVHA